MMDWRMEQAVERVEATDPAVAKEMRRIFGDETSITAALVEALARLRLLAREHEVLPGP